MSTDVSGEICLDLPSMPDPDLDEVIAFMCKRFPPRELANLCRRALRYFPPLGDDIEVAPASASQLGAAAEGSVDHLATALCTWLLFERKVQLSLLADFELRREVEARLGGIGIILLRTEECCSISWIEEPHQPIEITIEEACIP